MLYVVKYIYKYGVKQAPIVIASHAAYVQSVHCVCVHSNLLYTLYCLP